MLRGLKSLKIILMHIIFPHSLVIWNKTENSLSSNYYQKLSDGLKVYIKYEKFNLIKSLYYLLLLGINSIKRKI